MSDTKPRHDSKYDPRSVTDADVRDEHTREEVQRWREEAQNSHNGWMDVMKNRYGKD